MGTRSYFVLIASIAALALVVAGCSTKRRGGGPPGGGEDAGTPEADAGDEGSTDSGPVITLDSGPTGTDSGPTPDCTTTADCGAGEECIEGSCETVTTSCATSTVTRVTMQVCSDATRTCTEGCSDGACIADCLESDANPDCFACADNNIISCFNANGCQEQWNCFSECFTEFGCEDRACVEANCATEDAAYTACTETVPDSAMCGSSWTPCVGL